MAHHVLSTSSWGRTCVVLFLLWSPLPGPSHHRSGGAVVVVRAAFWTTTTTTKQKPEVPLGGISCDDGFTAVPAAWLNDDYCDCVDGADEPATAACAAAHKESGAVVVKKRWFECVNEGYASSKIPSSRVGDGVCGDCCDGSDEPPGFCEHACDAEAARLRAEQARLERVLAVGGAKRSEYVVEAQKRRESDAQALKEAKDLASQSAPEVERLKALVKDLERKQKEQREAEQKECDAEYERTGIAMLQQASQDSQDAIFMAAVRLAAAAGEMEALLDAVTSHAGLPEAITDAIDDVEVLSLGVDASDAFAVDDDPQQNPRDLHVFSAKCDQLLDALHLRREEETVSSSDESSTTDRARAVATAVADAVNSVANAARNAKLRDDPDLQRLDPLAAALVKPVPPGVFQKSAAEVHDKQKRRERPRRRTSPYDDDDDDRYEYDNDDDDEQEVAPPRGAPSEDEPLDELAAAKRELSELEASKRRADDRVRKLSADETADFGPDAAFLPLKGRCFKTRAAKYTYELCPFGEAKQDHTTIGRFDAWDDDGAVWRHKHGQYCAGHGARELKVNLECGETEELLDVSETQVCKYEATFRTPAACPPVVPAGNDDGQTAEPTNE